MKKRIAAAFLAALLLLTSASALAAKSKDGLTTIKGTLKTSIKLKKSYPDNEAIPGVNPLTGLPCDEAYTPVMTVLDGSPEAQPHWGVSKADIIFQIPNAGTTSTKLLAIFSSEYPEQVGPCRSARASMVPMAAAFDTVFAHAGGPNLGNVDADPAYLLRRFKLKSRGMDINLLGNNYRERIKEYGAGDHNLSCHVKEIHDAMIEKKVDFDARYFLFSDEPLTDGKEAGYVQVMHISNKDKKEAPQSTLRFTYDEERQGYSLVNCAGDFKDRLNDDEILFSNVIVLRCGLSWRNDGYFNIKNHLKGSGVIEVFQNGRYVRGAWFRESETSRLVLLGPDGKELPMQRGKTFFEVTTDVAEVSYK